MKRKFTGIFLLLMLFALSIGSASAQDANTTIVFDGTTASVDGNGVNVNGNIITITSAGTYSLSGTLTDGQVVVDSEADGLVTLILDGVNLTSSTSAPIYIKNADSAAILVADGTENTVTDAAVYIYETVEDDEPNAAVFSDDDLTIYGTGTLNVYANFNDGIASKDTLTIQDATLNVTSVDDGIRGKDFLVVDSGNLNITAQGDGLKSDNEDDTTLGYITINGGTFMIDAGRDAIQAESTLTINNGTFDVFTAGGSAAYIDDTLSAKGLKATTSVVINGGTFNLNTADDAVHSNDTIIVNTGTFTIATGDDGLHADLNLEINGGDINITDSYEGIESEVITINNGNIYVVASDDGLNVAGGADGSGFGGPGGGGGFGGGASSNYFMYINGGYIVVDAQGDGLEANGSIIMQNGTVIVNGPTESMNGALDYDGSFQLTGGTLIAVGSAGMMQAPDNSSTQYTFATAFNTTAQGTLSIQDSSGNTVFSFEPTKTYQSVVFSSPDLVGGETYTVTSGGTALTSVTLSGVVTQIGGGGFGGPGGGGRGGGGRP